MKNPLLCARCKYNRNIRNKHFIIGRSCTVPLEVIYDNEKKGRYENDTDDTCYDFEERI